MSSDHRTRRLRRRLIIFGLVALLLYIYLGWYLPNYGSGVPLLVSFLRFAFEIALFMFIAVIQFVAIFWFLGRARVYWLGPGETGITFADYRGNRDVLELASRIVTLLRGVKRFRDMGGEVPRGLLLIGPPGTGKTYLAQAIATEAQVPFCYASAPSFQNMFWGVGNLRIMSIYRVARKKAREYGAAIVFIDEIDAIGMSRSGQMGGGMFGGGLFGGGLGLLNELLLQMDPPAVDDNWSSRLLRSLGLLRGKAIRPVVFTIGATNLPEVLDQALLRPGRFDHRITIDAPDMDGRLDILEYYLDKVIHDSEFPMRRAAADTIGYTPVMIRHVINEGVVFAHFSGRDNLTYEDFTAAREGYEWGLRQPIRSLGEEDRRRLAYHEAGHAVAQYLLLPQDRMVKVTIVRHGEALGLSATKPVEERYTRSEEEIRAEIQCALASRAAEELFLGLRLSGVVEDLTQATRLAAAAIGWLGMDGSLYSYRAFGQNTPDSPARRRIDKMLSESYEAVKRLLGEHRNFVEIVAQALLDRHEVTGDEMDAVARELGIPEPAPVAAAVRLGPETRLPAPGLPTPGLAGGASALPAAGAAPSATTLGATPTVADGARVERGSDGRFDADELSGGASDGPLPGSRGGSTGASPGTHPGEPPTAPGRDEG